MKVWGDGHLDSLLEGLQTANWEALPTCPSTLYVYLSFDRNHFISRHFPKEIIGQLPRIYMVTATFLKKNPHQMTCFSWISEREEGGCERKTSIASICCPIGIKPTTEVCTLDRESNLRPFSALANDLTTEHTGQCFLKCNFLIIVKNLNVHWLTFA